MGELDRLIFARLCYGGARAHFLTAGCITGAGVRIECYATRQSTQKRFIDRFQKRLPVVQEQRALLAFLQHANRLGWQDFQKLVADDDTHIHCAICTRVTWLVFCTGRCLGHQLTPHPTMLVDHLADGEVAVWDEEFQTFRYASGRAAIKEWLGIEV